MNKRLRIGMLSAILAVTFAVAVQAEEKKECGTSTPATQACMNRDKAMCSTAKIEVTNTEDGVIVKIATANPEHVKKIQTCWANKTACKATRSTANKKAQAACGSTKKDRPCPSVKSAE